MESRAFEEWIAEAKRVDLTAWAVKREPAIRRNGRDLVGPCPGCGGEDRFSISIQKNVWFCRKFDGGRGGDVIALACHVENVDFIGACEVLTGAPPPGRASTDTPEARAEREARASARHAAAATESAARAKQEADFREAERGRAWKIWCRAKRSLVGTPVEAYLALRGLALPADARLRYAAKHPLYVHQKQPDGRFKPIVLHEGPAMIAGITGADHRFAGVHATWIDLSQPDGKALVADPKTGEFQPAKKVRGSVHGARIELVPHEAPVRLFLGEGNETCLSAFQALVRVGSPLVVDAALWAGVSLPNMAGRALDRVRHPFLVDTDSLGRERVRQVPGTIPDPRDVIIPIPPSVHELVWLGDGDSDRFTTECALQRAANRHHRDGLAQAIAWAEPGQDFNTMLRGAA